MASWRDKAECKGLPIEWFFGKGGYKKGYSVCNSCSVKPECLDAAIEEEARYYLEALSAGQKHICKTTTKLERWVYGLRGGMSAAKRVPFVIEKAREIYDAEYVDHS